MLSACAITEWEVCLELGRIVGVDFHTNADFDSLWLGPLFHYRFLLLYNVAT